MLLHLSRESVREDRIKSEIARTNKLGSKFVYTDLFGHGPIGMIEWTSQYSDTGVMGEAEKATAEKGRLCFEEASKNLAAWIAEYHAMEIRPRTPHQDRRPTIPLQFPTD